MDSIQKSGSHVSGLTITFLLCLLGAFALLAGCGGGGDSDHPPMVLLTSPTAGALLSGTIPVSVTASDDLGVEQVEILVDGTPVGVTETEPYSITLDTTLLSNGVHDITAMATDTTGQSTTFSMDVVVNNPEDPASDQPPQVNLVSPTAGAILSGQITVTVSATDDAGILQVALKVDGSVIETLEAEPFVFTLDTETLSDGVHILTVTATDTTDQTTSASADVTVNNNAPSEDNPPTVQLTSPLEGETISGMFTVIAAASDDFGITKVELLVDGNRVPVGEGDWMVDTDAPYTFDLITLAIANGSHTLSAVATDTAGQIQSSVSITITVDN